jgi:hypothetical protein
VIPSCIEAIRSLFGDPEWITSRHSRSPLQGEVQGETKMVTILDYSDVQRTGDFPYIAPNMQVVIADNPYSTATTTWRSFASSAPMALLPERGVRCIITRTDNPTH